MNTIYVGYDNKLVHQLQYTLVGSNQIRNFDLTTASEFLIQFFNEDRELRKSYSNLTHAGLSIEDAAAGFVSYKPLSTDFEDVSDYTKITNLRWVVKSTEYPTGLIFDRPMITIKIVR